MRALSRIIGRRRAPELGGRMASLGQDHAAGHLSYVCELTPEGRRWLRTKPFSAPPNYELARCLHSFAHIVENLALPPGARVLDVGCGPGWISEWLVRCGFRVTGVDISPDMLVVARERIAAIDPEQLGAELTAEATFEAMPVREIAWEDRFDAAILYDAMHHFDDEAGTLAAIHRALVPGGRIYIHEGVRPAPGSQGERELIAEMERYGTLEAPFDPDYLVAAVRAAGFDPVERLVEVDRLMPADRPRQGGKEVQAMLAEPATNTLIGHKGLTDEGDYAAEIAVVDQRREAGGLLVTLRVTNSGTAPWRAAPEGRLPAGAVSLGPYLPDPSAPGGRRELGRRTLPRSLDPGEAVSVVVTLRDAELAGAGVVEFSVVRERVAWLTDLGSAPGRLALDPDG